MPTWRFRWWQCVIFTGPFWSYQGIAALRRARACSLNLHAHAGGPWHAFNKVCVSETQPCAQLMLLLRTWNWCINYFELLSSSPQENKSPQSCWGAAAHVPEPTPPPPRLRSKYGSGKTEQSPLRVRESNQTQVKNHFRCRTKQNARVQRWHDFQLDVPTFNGSTRRKLLVRRLWRRSLGFSCHPPLLKLRLSPPPLSLSLSLSLLLSECCLPAKQCYLFYW